MIAAYDMSPSQVMADYRLPTLFGVSGILLSIISYILVINQSTYQLQTSFAASHRAQFEKAESRLLQAVDIVELYDNRADKETASPFDALQRILARSSLQALWHVKGNAAPQLIYQKNQAPPSSLPPIKKLDVLENPDGKPLQFIHIEHNLAEKPLGWLAIILSHSHSNTVGLVDLNSLFANSTAHVTLWDESNNQLISPRQAPAAMAAMWPLQPQDTYPLAAFHLKYHFSQLVLPWSVAFTATQSYLANAPSLLAWVTLAGGLLLTALISAIILIQVQQTVRIRRVVTAQTKDLLKLNAHLETSAESLRESNEELEQFAYVASHDLKAPLRAIDNLSLWIEEDIAEHLTGETYENMKLMRSRVRRMERLLDDLLDYSRIGRKLQESEVEWVSLPKLVSHIAELTDLPKQFTYHQGEGLKGIELPNMPWAQVLQNLVSNAIKHHDRLNGTIMIDAEINTEAGQLILSVGDDGPGIAPKFHECIFNMFQTLKPRDQVEGSGMGLSIVRKIMHRQGGEVDLKSTEGEGTVFYLYIPLPLTRLAEMDSI